MNTGVVNENDREKKMIGYLAAMVLSLGYGQLSSGELSAIAKIADEFGGFMTSDDILTL